MQLNKTEKKALKRGSFGIDNHENRTNNLTDWEQFFCSKKLILADLSHKSFDSILEPIARTQKVDQSERWIKKFQDEKKWLPGDYTLEQYYRDYYEVENALKQYSLESLNLFDNNLWINSRGFEYFQILKSGYKHGVINHACSDVRLINNEFVIEVHPGRHSHWARRFLEQRDIHFLSIPKKHYEKFISEYNVIVLDEIHCINDIIKSLPNKCIKPRIFLQGVASDFWPFVVTELNLSDNSWGFLDPNNQITINQSLKNNISQYRRWVKKLLSGYNPKQDYDIAVDGDTEYIQKLFFGFILNNNSKDSIIRPKSG